MPNQPSLPTCALPGCTTPVGSWGEVCDGCVAICGPFLRRGGERLGEAEIVARDGDVAAAYAMQAVS